MGSRESLPSAVDLFGGSRDACRHSKHFEQALDSLSRAFYFGSWILKDFRLCTFVLFRSSFWILDIGHDRFSHLVESSRGNILLTKGTVCHV